MPARSPEEEWKVGRYAEAAPRSGRVGPAGRTFHARVTSMA